MVAQIIGICRLQQYNLILQINILLKHTWYIYCYKIGASLWWSTSHPFLLLPILLNPPTTIISLLVY